MNGQIVAQGEQVLIDVTIPLNFFLAIFFTTLKGKDMCPSLLADPKTMNLEVHDNSFVDIIYQCNIM